MKTYLIGIVLILVSCNGQKKAIVKNSDSFTNSETSLVLLLQDEHGGLELEETMVIKDQKRLNAFYSKINRTRKPGLQVPIIDFSKELVIIQCSGEQNYSGTPTLNFIKENNAQIVLNSKFERNSKEPATAVLTNPFCVYKMPLTEKEVVVEHE